MRVLVTGGGGFIGRATCQQLARAGHKVVVFDRHREPSDWAVILGDIRDATAVTEAVAHAEAVIHLAGVLGTQETITNPLPAAETNVIGGLNVLLAAAQYGLPLVNIAVGNWFEVNTYSITKQAIERFVRMNAAYRGQPQCSVRAFNAYGPGQSVSAPYGPSKVRKILPSFITRALHGDPIQVYGDGQQVMDMVWAGDVATVLVAALEHLTERGAPQDGIIFEAGSGLDTTVLHVAKLVQAEVEAQTGRLAPIDHLPLRPGETAGVIVQADMTMTTELLGLEPAQFTPLDEGVRRTVAYYARALAVTR